MELPEVQLKKNVLLEKYLDGGTIGFKVLALLIFIPINQFL